MKSISILGATGSVGRSTVKVLEAQDEAYNVQVLTANSNWKLLAEQAIALKAKHVAIADEQFLDDLKQALSGQNIQISAGRQAILEAASIPADWTMAAIVGMAGLEPLMKSIEQGGVIAIANKEPLVSAGDLVLAAAKKYNATILPVDSEHNAIFQVFEKNNNTAIDRIILTASGGPFRKFTKEEMAQVTVEQALTHPNWSMGDKISIDSATMMNKALEIIEAQKLFNMRPDQIDVLIHPQSIIHSMVEYSDGSVLAQMGAADMCTPITNTLGYPKRLKTPGQKLDLTQMKHLDFDEVDRAQFPFVTLAYECLHNGQAACIALNAANEVAVKAFLDHQIAFLDIYKIVSEMVASRPEAAIDTLENIISYDNTIRIQTESYIVSRELKNTKTVNT